MYLFEFLVFVEYQIQSGERFRFQKTYQLVAWDGKNLWEHEHRIRQAFDRAFAHHLEGAGRLYGVRTGSRKTIVRELGRDDPVTTSDFPELLRLDPNQPEMTALPAPMA